MSLRDLVELENKKLAELDAEVIDKACKGEGKMDHLLINAICSRSKPQLVAIDTIFRQRYGTTLADQLNSECKGDYKDFLVACATPSGRYWAELFHRACKGEGTNERLMIEILCSRESTEIEEMKKEYQSKFNKSLVDAVKEDLRSDLETLFVNLVENPRETGDKTDVDLAKDQAERLNDATKGAGADEKVFIEILSSSTRIQVQAIEQVYENKYKKSLASTIKGAFQDKLQEAMLALLWPSPASYSAGLLHEAMKREDIHTPLIHILGGTDKREVKKLVTEYESLFGKRLKDDLRRETSGGFLDAIECWIETDDPSGLSIGKDKPLVKVASDLELAIAERDADYVFLACKAVGTDEKALIDVLCSRNKHQIRRIDTIFREKYGKSLSDQIEADCCGDFNKLLKFIAMPTAVVDVYWLNKTFAKVDTNKENLLVCLSFLSNARIWAAKAQYEATQGHSLDDRINKELSGHLKTLAFKLIKGERSEGLPIRELAVKQAAELHSPGAEQWGTDEEKFIEILGSLSFPQVKLLKEVYEEEYKESLVDAIKKQTSGSLEKALVFMSKDPVECECECLYNVFTNWDTNDIAVCEILGGNDKPEVKDLADKYKEKYGSDLVDDLKREASGNVSDDFLRAAEDWVRKGEYSEGLYRLLAHE